MSRPPPPVKVALRHVASGDFEGARRSLEAEGEHVGVYYADVTRALYAKKNVGGMLAMGRFGVDYRLRQAKRGAIGEAERSEHRRAAKNLAYNVAANCWPGWGDPGIVIDDSHIEGGLELAKRSLKEVRALALGDQQLGTAYWLIGALHLAANRAKTALANFDRARDCYESAGKSLEVLLVDGYRAIARCIARPEVVAEARLAEVLAQIKKRRSKKAAFFSGQLHTAARILRDRSPR